MAVTMGQQHDFAELVRKSQDGDRGSFGKLIRHFEDRLATVIKRQLGEALKKRVDPEDVLQETLLRALQSFERFQWDGEEALFRWLSTIARHIVFELAAAKKRDSSFPIDRDPTDSDPTRSKAFRRAERFDRLQSAFDALSPDQQRVVYLARVERVPVQEIAREMGRTPNAISHVLLRALHKLRGEFGDTESLSLLPEARLRRRKVANDE